MSINFDDPMNEDAIRMMKEIAGEPDVMDEKHALYSKFEPLYRRQLTELANAAKQPVEVQLHGLGDIKEMSDGTRYVCTNQGWLKLADK